MLYTKERIFDDFNKIQKNPNRFSDPLIRGIIMEYQYTTKYSYTSLFIRRKVMALYATFRVSLSIICQHIYMNYRERTSVAIGMFQRSETRSCLAAHVRQLSPRNRLEKHGPHHWEVCKSGQEKRYTKA